MNPRIERLDATAEELEALVEKARVALDEAGYEKLMSAIGTLGYVTALLEDQRTSLQSLRNLLCAKQTEKTADLLKRAGIEGEKTPAAPKPKAPGHGRHGAKAYRGAQRVHVPHASLKAGDRCPECEHGKVYPQREPGVLVRLIGQAPMQATVYELEKLRCNLCVEVYTAQAPAGVSEEEKYDVTVGSMIAILRYGSGFPMHRLEKMQDSLGIPLPASVQWEIACAMVVRIAPAFDELVRQAAQGDVLHNDDTSMPVLSLRRDIDDQADESERTGIFTSGLVSTCEGRQLALFFTARQHAGENLRDVLLERATAMKPPIQMCDALARTLPKMPEKLEVIVSHCLAHARRRFVEVIPNFPDACQARAGGARRGVSP